MVAPFWYSSTYVLLNSWIQRRPYRPPLISQPPKVLFKTEGLRASHHWLTSLLMFVFSFFKLLIEKCIQKIAHIISVQLDVLPKSEHIFVTRAHINKQYMTSTLEATVGPLSTHLPQKQPLSWLLTAYILLVFLNCL